ncbi:hypothetical protein SAMN03159382_05872 [Pseudomonas sp. NFACC23-1]|uniref:hypothetical protein n=1 Tax=unclassified Pseudomonas TaxID=196821 RepID=UPI0008833F2C|nr:MULTISPECIES: hypothetical protein [unclassified Pseudomonas]SDB67009.1 hypothetical protein SAMN03159386_05882 [Pseudomonas sp. NFACC17-2]SEJ98564.1 hypothetical protein SAMN03159382_05872 [Pseudomonas sp. NFACC23-1]SFW93042.1 hypothetical protein SAMN05660640_05957 [Pseudomonas sp. NFACC16-2]
MLKAPFTDLPYEPTVDMFLAGLETEYNDREFKDGLLRLDPNSKVDRLEIIKKYIIKNQEYLSYRHKFLLVKELEKALLNKGYNFAAVFEYDYDKDEPSPSPWSASEIETPRSFFEDVFNMANEIWRNEILRAAMEDPSAW